MMSKPWKLFIILLVQLFAVIAVQTPSTTRAQGVVNYVFVPTLSELGCNISARACIFDASYPSQLMVYVVETAQLWKYPANGAPSTHYDLSPYQTAFGTTLVLDFVSLSDTELLFIGTQYDSRQDELTIFSTVTNQIRRPTIDFGATVLTGCDSTPSIPIDNLYVFPSSSRVLLCGVEQGHRKLLIVDVASEQIERVIDIPASAANPGLLPWRRMLLGLDGNVYIQGPSVGGEDVRDIFDTINRPPLLNDVVRVLRFNPLDSTWTLLQLPVTLLSSDGLKLDSRPASISELAGVDEQGNMYYWDYPIFQYAPLLTVFDISGQFNGQVSTQALASAGTGNLLYHAATGELIFVNSDSPSGLASIDPGEFLPTPLPTATQMEGFVAVQSRTGDALRVPVTVELYQDDQLIAAFNPTLDAQGSFTLDGVQPGVYQVWLKTDQTLAVLQTVDTTTGESHNFGTLVNGDVNNDNTTSMLDFSFISASFGKALGNPGYDSRADLNGDNVVSLLDYSIFAGSYGQSGAARPGSGGAALALFAAPRSTEDGISFRMSPASRTLRVGQEFDVTVRVQGNRLVVDGAALYLDFDPSVLQVVSMTGDTSLDTIVRSTYENVFGRIEFVAGALEAFPTAPFRLVTIRFRATAPSTGTSIMLSPRELPWLSDITAGGDSVFAEANSINVVIR